LAERKYASSSCCRCGNHLRLISYFIFSNYPYGISGHHLNCGRIAHRLNLAEHGFAFRKQCFFLSHIEAGSFDRLNELVSASYCYSDLRFMILHYFSQSDSIPGIERTQAQEILKAYTRSRKTIHIGPHSNRSACLQ
jgi:hypothetical protein